MTKLRKIYLIRHCEPQLPGGIPVCMGKNDIPLSEKGVRQAVELKDYFSRIDISGIYTSPLVRAMQTADIIADGNHHILIKHDLAEYNIGKWDGMSFDEIKEKYPKEYKERGENLENYVVEGGESMAMCRERALPEFLNIVNQSTGNIIIVSHAGVNRIILSHLLEISVMESFSYKHDFGSVNILIYEKESFTIKKIGASVSELTEKQNS